MRTDGLIPRAMQQLFGRIANASHHSRGAVQHHVRASFCEIYNEKVYDLLNGSSKTLPVRWNAQTGFFVQGLMLLECDNLDDVMAIVSEGASSHCVSRCCRGW